MKIAGYIAGLFAVLMAGTANAYTQSMTCKTLKGPSVGYRPDGGTFKVTSVTDGDTAPVWKVLGVWSPGSAHEAITSQLGGGPMERVILSEPNAEFVTAPTYRKVDGEYQVTSAQFKVTSKMRRDIRSDVKGIVKDLVQVGMSAEQIAAAKLKLDAVLDAALSEQPVDSEVLCSVVGR